MFCTGGIRCEKSTSLLLEHGFEDVYHLQGGILKYLELVPPEKSLWEGECFVFDERVSVGHGLKPGPHELCRCCREPLPPKATGSPLYELGVSCPRCHANTSEVQKNSARESLVTCRRTCFVFIPSLSLCHARSIGPFVLWHTL